MKKEMKEALEMIPEIVDNQGDPRVVGALKVETVLVKYIDGSSGKEEVKLGFVIGDEVRFIDPKILSKPANKWLSDGVLSFIRTKFSKKEAKNS